MACANGKGDFRTTSGELASVTQLALAQDGSADGKVGVATIECQGCGEEEKRALGKASMILWANMLIGEDPENFELREMLQTVISDFTDQPSGPSKTVIVR